MLLQSIRIWFDSGRFDPRRWDSTLRLGRCANSDFHKTPISRVRNGIRVAEGGRGMSTQPGPASSPPGSQASLPGPARDLNIPFLNIAVQADNLVPNQSFPQWDILCDLLMIQLCLAWAAAPLLDISLGSLNGKRKWKQFSAQFNSNYAGGLETGDTMRSVRNTAQTSISVQAKPNLTKQNSQTNRELVWGKHVMYAGIFYTYKPIS